MSKEMIDALRKASEEQLKYALTSESINTIDHVTSHSIIQTYVLLEMLDMLDSINEKLSQANINIQDVEQEVSKLNPNYK